MKVQVAFLYKEDNLVCNGIKLWTSRLAVNWREVACHVEISLDSDQWYSSDPSSLIFRKKCMRLELDNRYRIYTFDVSAEEYLAMKKVADGMLGMEYDWLNILGSDIFHLNIDEKDKVTCDESVSRILLHSWMGKDLKDIPNLNPHTLEKYIIKKLNYDKIQ